MSEPAFPNVEYLTRIEAEVDQVLDVGDTLHGHRRIVPILGGSAQGPVINGRILPGGADFQLIRSGTIADLEARYVIETPGGERVYVTNLAYRTGTAEDIAALSRGQEVPPERIYFRSSPRFEVAGQELSWLESTVVVGSGHRKPDSVVLDLWALL